MRGWDTGTLEVSDVSLKVNESHKADFEAEKTRLRVVTTDKTESIPKKNEIGKGGGALSALGIGAKPDAIAVLWMQDLTDDIEQDVQIPVFVSDDIQLLKQNVINDQTKKHHDFTLVGTLSARIKLDSGLDEDHEVGLVMT